MSAPDQPQTLLVQVEAGAGATPEETDALARQLLAELRELEVESAELAAGEAAPEGTKSGGEMVTLGALMVAVLPTFLPKLVDFVQAWALRGQGRTVKFKGRVGGQEVEFEGTADELKALLNQLSAAPPSPAPDPATS